MARQTLDVGPVHDGGAIAPDRPPVAHHHRDRRGGSGAGDRRPGGRRHRRAVANSASLYGKTGWATKFQHCGQMDGNYGAASNAERVSAAGQIRRRVSHVIARRTLGHPTARTGAGKGVGFCLPNCFAWQGSLVVLDVKGEAFRATAGHRKAMGQDVYLFDPASESGRSHRWDPFAAVQRTTAARFRQIARHANLLFPEMDQIGGSANNHALGRRRQTGLRCGSDHPR